MKSRIRPILLLLPLLAGCQTATESISTTSISDDAAIAAARKAVIDNLIDPQSAQFGPRFSRRLSMGLDVVCGTVNAKNRFGGYTGRTVFAYRIGDGRVLMAGEPDYLDPIRPAVALCDKQ